MAIIIPHQLSLAPLTCPPSRFQRTASQSTAVRFFVSISPLFCFQQSSLPSPSVCFLVSFVPHLRSFRSALSFPLFRIFVPFGLLFRFLRSVSSFLSVRSFVFFGTFLSFFRSALSFSSVRFLFLLVRFYEALCRSQVFSLLILSLLLSGIFVPFKSDTRLSTLETMPFNVRDNALLAPRPRPSTFKNTPFFFRLRMCLISCQLRVRFCPMLPSLRRDFCVCHC